MRMRSLSSNVALECRVRKIGISRGHGRYPARVLGAMGWARRARPNWGLERGHGLAGYSGRRDDGGLAQGASITVLRQSLARCVSSASFHNGVMPQWLSVPFLANWRTCAQITAWPRWRRQMRSLRRAGSIGVPGPAARHPPKVVGVNERNVPRQVDRLAFRHPGQTPARGAPVTVSAACTDMLCCRSREASSRLIRRATLQP